MFERFPAFFALSALVIVAPGPDTALAIRNTLLGGRRAGTLTAIGVASGQAIWTLGTSLGLAALLTASRPAFGVVRWLGAGYLVFLGARAILEGLRSKAGPAGTSPAETLRHRLAPGAAFRQGLLSNLGNPKMAVFFPSLLPQFVARGGAPFGSLVLLGCVFCLLTLAWLTLYAVAIARAGDILRRTGLGRTFQALTGAALVAFGIHLATERR